MSTLLPWFFFIVKNWYLKNVYVYKQIFVLHGLEDKVCNMKLNTKIFIRNIRKLHS